MQSLGFVRRLGADSWAVRAQRLDWESTGLAQGTSSTRTVLCQPPATTSHTQPGRGLQGSPSFGVSALLHPWSHSDLDLLFPLGQNLSYQVFKPFIAPF